MSTPAQRLVVLMSTASPAAAAMAANVVALGFAGVNVRLSWGRDSSGGRLTVIESSPQAVSKSAPARRPRRSEEGKGMRGLLECSEFRLIHVNRTRLYARGFLLNDPGLPSTRSRW